jgi:hypothetical protein
MPQKAHEEVGADLLPWVALEYVRGDLSQVHATGVRAKRITVPMGDVGKPPP